MKGVLALRFDVDSVTCIQRGIPRLRRMADRLGVRFTFFVNMGYSFNWSHNIRHFLARRRRRPSAPAVPPTPKMPTTAKLGWDGVLKTVLLNPRLGERYRDTFDALHADGHELGLHGGTDHVIWQRSLDELGPEGLERLLGPAFELFSERYGQPAGFASPGFRYNDDVLRLLDSRGFTYASDMIGEEPFRSVGSDGTRYEHFQVPVNVWGEDSVPLVEQGRARGVPDKEIEKAFIDAVVGREFAMAYGHPYVEGIEAPLVGRVLERLRETHEVVTVSEYLRQWRGRNG